MGARIDFGRYLNSSEYGADFKADSEQYEPTPERLVNQGKVIAGPKGIKIIKRNGDNGEDLGQKVIGRTPVEKPISLEEDIRNNLGKELKDFRLRKKTQGALDRGAIARIGMPPASETPGSQPSV